MLIVFVRMLYMCSSCHVVVGATKAFAIITANETEQKIVRHFFKLFQPGEDGAGEVWPEAVECNYSSDFYLKKQKVEVKYDYTSTFNTRTDEYDFEVFTVSKEKAEMIGIHTKCLQQGSNTDGGSRKTTTALLQFAKKNSWQLEVIFCVGCCGLSADDKSERNVAEMMGTVLLSNVYEAFLDRGKVEGADFRFHSQFYKGTRAWVHRLKNDSITKPGQHDDPKKFRKIPVKEVPRFLSGPVVCKSTDFGDGIRGNAYIVGIEMEGSGIASALEDWEDMLPKFLLLKGVSDFGENKGKKVMTKFFDEPTKEEVKDDVRQQIATFHCIALVARGVAQYFLCTQRPPVDV